MPFSCERFIHDSLIISENRIFHEMPRISVGTIKDADIQIMIERGWR